jgi:hypothetical protein
MARTRSTIFRPILGCGYIVENTKTREKIICKVLRLEDASKYGPVRSGRICKRGAEFFKVLIGDRCYTMNNSIENENCLSEDKNWVFTGERPEAKSRKGKVNKEKKESTKRKPKVTKEIKLAVEFVSNAALSKII